MNKFLVMNDLLFIKDEIKDFAKANLKKGDEESIEKVLSYLKENGVAQMQSVFLLIQELEISIHEANRYVMNSRAWNG
jgi:hypothetical protein